MSTGHPTGRSDDAGSGAGEGTPAVTSDLKRSIKAAVGQVAVTVAPTPTRAEARSGETVHELDAFDLATFLPEAARFGQERYGFVVTPNVDHLIRFHEDSTYRGYCRGAAYVLLDSRFAARLVRLTKGIDLPVCTGSDLTAALFKQVISRGDRILLIGGSEEQAAMLARAHGLDNMRHYNPPMGFAKDAQAFERCLRFIEAESPFRFCFLAVGCPQQEALAEALRTRGVARGLALCIGASLNFLTGREKRAPQWMQSLSLEWLYRLAQDPRRLASRYLVRGPRFFGYLRHARFVSRRTSPKAA